MKHVGSLLAGRLLRILTVGEIQFVFMSENGIMDAVFILAGCKKSIMLKKKVIYVLSTWKKLLTE